MNWHYTNTEEKEYEVMAVIEPLPASMNMHAFSLNSLTVVVPLEDMKKSPNAIMFAKTYTVDEKDQPAFESYLENYTEQVNTSMGYLSKSSLEEDFSGMVNSMATVGYALCAVIGIIGILNERTDQENAPLGKRVLYPDLRIDQCGFWKPGGLLSGKCIERCDHVFPVSVYGSALYPYDTTVYGLRTGNFPGGLSADSEKERGGTAPGK